ncbi:MAG: choice-of-anchor Q domain-containing protein, partial [Hyphomicrobiales bacterium]
ACSLQGIGLFDGMFVNWQIENNLIVTDHWHGITVMGAKNVRIINNTVVDPLVGKPTAPWIAITAHKKGMPPRGSIIANNIAASYNQTGRKSFPATSSKQVLMRNNISITNPNALFKDVVTLDFRPRERSAIINAGTSKFAPKLDINGTPRPTGSAIDIGAFQSR